MKVDKQPQYSSSPDLYWKIW